MSNETDMDWLARPEEFKPIISIEDNQEQDMKQDNGWFERGELPPVGAECEIHHQCWNDGKFERVQIAAITKEYVIVDDLKHEQHYSRKHMSFRPICTKRKMAIDEIANVICESNRFGYSDEYLAGVIYDLVVADERK